MHLGADVSPCLRKRRRIGAFYGDFSLPGSIRDGAFRTVYASPVVRGPCEGRRGQGGSLSAILPMR